MLTQFRLQSVVQPVQLCNGALMAPIRRRSFFSQSQNGRSHLQCLVNLIDSLPVPTHKHMYISTGKTAVPNPLECVARDAAMSRSG